MKNSFGTGSKWWLPGLSNQLQHPGVSGQHDLRPSQAHRYEEWGTGPDRLAEGHLHGEMKGLGPGALGHSRGDGSSKAMVGSPLPFSSRSQVGDNSSVKHQGGWPGP